MCCIFFCVIELQQFTVQSFYQKEMHRDPFYTNPHMSLIYTSPKGTNLWLGDYSGALDFPFLQKMSIKAVLTIGKGIQIEYKKESGITHKVVPVLDIANYKIRPHFSECRQFILENMTRGKNILVHCNSGISSSSTIVIAFLMQKLNLSYLRAFAYVKKKRHLIDPNYGFKDQLIKYEKKLAGLQNLKEHFKKPETSRNINSISSYIIEQKQIQSSRLMNVFSKKSEQIQRTPRKFRRASECKTKGSQNIRARVKSQTSRYSLPKINENQ